MTNHYIHGYLCGYLRKTATLSGVKPYDAGGTGTGNSAATNPTLGSAPDGRMLLAPEPKVEVPDTENIGIEAPSRKTQDFRGMQ